jgi:hypothetical protein
MDFSYMGGNVWGTDQVSSTTPMNYDMSDIFVTQPKIDKQLRWPVSEYKMPNPQIKEKIKIPKKREEGFVVGGEYIHMTENMLILLLLIILIIICSMVYSSVRETREMMKLVVSILAAKQ